MHKVWEEISTYLIMDDTLESAEANLAALAGSRGERRPSTISVGAKGDIIRDGKPGNGQSHYLRGGEEKILQVHLSAAQNAVEELQEENARLQQQLEDLEEEAQHGTLGRWLAKFRKDSDSEKSDSEEEELTEEEKEKRREELEDLKAPEDMRESQCWIRGHFLGCCATKKHYMDISLPIKGTFEAAHVLKVLNHCAEHLALKIAAQSKIRSDGEGHVKENAWKQLAALLQESCNVEGVELGAAAALPAPAGPPPQAPVADPLQAMLGDPQEMLDALMMDNLRMQCEMDTVRQQHAKWASFIASTHLEVTARQQLERSTPDGETRQAGAGPDRSLVQLWREPQPLRELGSPTSATSAGGRTAAAAAAAASTEPRVRGGTGGGRAGEAQQPARTGAQALSPTVGRTVQAAADESKSLTEELKKLESWAKEMRAHESSFAQR